MKEITILYTPPIVLTKDKNWRPKPNKTKGAIIYLPDDAVLVVPHFISEVKEK